jgi:hypothetical protein
MGARGCALKALEIIAKEAPEESVNTATHNLHVLVYGDFSY